MRTFISSNFWTEWWIWMQHVPKYDSKGHSYFIVYIVDSTTLANMPN
jgi:hypothetical protein